MAAWMRNAREAAAEFRSRDKTDSRILRPIPIRPIVPAGKKKPHEPVKRLPNGSYFLTRYDDLVGAYKSHKTLLIRQEEGVFSENGKSLLLTSTTLPYSLQ